MTLPQEMPRLYGDDIVLRPFEDRDAGMVMTVASDPLIPLITTVPTSGTRNDALAYIELQRSRLAATPCSASAATVKMMSSTCGTVSGC